MLSGASGHSSCGWCRAGSVRGGGGCCGWVEINGAACCTRAGDASKWISQIPLHESCQSYLHEVGHSCTASESIARLRAAGHGPLLRMGEPTSCGCASPVTFACQSSRVCAQQFPPKQPRGRGQTDAFGFPPFTGLGWRRPDSSYCSETAGTAAASRGRH